MAFRCAFVLLLALSLQSTIQGFRMIKKHRSNVTVQSAIDNRGTGLEPGEWKVDGGLKWNGVDINPSFKLMFKVNSINNNEMNIDALDTSRVDGDDLPDGGYKGLVLTQKKVKTGLFKSRTGYYYKGKLCTKTKGSCLNEILVENNQQKLRIYGKVSGISAWVITGNDASQSGSLLQEEEQENSLVMGNTEVEAVMTDCGKGKTLCQIDDLPAMRFKAGVPTVIKGTGRCPGAAVNAGSFAFDGRVGPIPISVAPASGDKCPCDFCEPEELAITVGILGEFGRIKWPGAGCPLKAGEVISLPIEVNMRELSWAMRKAAILPTQMEMNGYSPDGQHLMCASLTAKIL